MDLSAVLSIFALVDYGADHLWMYDAAYNPKDKDDFERQLKDAIRSGAKDHETGEDLGAEDDVCGVMDLLAKDEGDVMFFVRRGLKPTSMSFVEDRDDYDPKVFTRYLNYESLCWDMKWPVTEKKEETKKKKKTEEDEGYSDGSSSSASSSSSSSSSESEEEGDEDEDLEIVKARAAEARKRLLADGLATKKKVKSTSEENE
jgi:hypothetical protein